MNIESKEMPKVQFLLSRIYGFIEGIYANIQKCQIHTPFMNPRLIILRNMYVKCVEITKVSEGFEGYL